VSAGKENDKTTNQKGEKKKKKRNQNGRGRQRVRELGGVRFLYLLRRAQTRLQNDRGKSICVHVWEKTMTNKFIVVT